TFSAITAIPVESIKFHPSLFIKYAYHFAYANATLNSSRSFAYQSRQKLVIKKKRSQVYSWQSTRGKTITLIPKQAFSKTAGIGDEDFKSSREGDCRLYYADNF
ncbi:MAG: hypothetical protein WCR20_23385, partial [Verrucomicrobiota bacterium]